MIDLSTIDFALPLAFLLAPLPLLVRRLLPPAAERGGALVVPETIAAGFAPSGSLLAAAENRQVPAWILWLLMVLALAGPRTVAAAPAAPASGRDIVLSLDVSGSMERPDFVVDGEKRRRIDVLKATARAFVLGRTGDRVGLVIFGERAYVAAPLTFDVAAVAAIVDGLEVGLAGRSTAIGEGLGLALKRLSESAATSKVVVLLSDGAQNAGTVEPLSAAALARSLGIKVDTISMGPIDLGEGERGDEGVDTPTLRAVAETAGGGAFRARTTEELAEVMASIDALETSAQLAPPAIVHRSLWPYPGALALGLAGAMMLSRVRRGRG